MEQLRKRLWSLSLLETGDKHSNVTLYYWEDPIPRWNVTLRWDFFLGNSSEPRQTGHLTGQASYPRCNRDCGSALVTETTSPSLVCACRLRERCLTRGWESLETLFLASFPLVWSFTLLESCLTRGRQEPFASGVCLRWWPRTVRPVACGCPERFSSFSSELVIGLV